MTSYVPTVASAGVELVRGSIIRSVRVLAAAGAIVCLTASFLVPGVSLAQPDSLLVGTWMGTLEVGAGELRLVLNVAAGADGALEATLDSPDQGASGIPVGSVSLEEGTVLLTVPSIAGRFEGNLDQRGQQIAGKWSQGGQSLPLVMDRVDEAPVVSRPQEPTPPFPYESADIRFPGTEAGIELAGTLTLPWEAGLHPAVVLISGSGPQDRDETIFNHRPFLVLSDYLTRRGVAVLRYDDRGTGSSTGTFATATTEDFANDARSAVAYLRAHANIDDERIGLLGHSEGGLIAPMVAAEAPDEVALLVLLASPAVPGAEILYLQDSLIAQASGASDEFLALSRQRKEIIFKVLESEPDLQAGAQRLEQAMREMELTEEEQEGLRAAGMEVDDLIAQQVQQLNTPWFRFFVGYDPRPALERLRVPVLALAGELDLQVPPEQNLPVLEQALERSESGDYQVRALPGLNHLFQSADTGLPSEYARIEETFSPSALEVIATWILEHTGAEGRE